MSRLILILVIIFSDAIVSSAQDSLWIYDPWSKKINIYFTDIYYDKKPEVLDSNSEIFRKVKTTVLDYCHSHYRFRIDTCIIYSKAQRWRSISFTDDADPRVVEKYKKEHLWYELFFTLRIKPGVTYELAYLLDSTAEHIEEAPMGIAASSLQQIRSIKDWDKLSHLLRDYRKDYPVPVFKPTPELQYWPATKCYVYYVISCCAKTKADMKKASYEVCDKTMIIDAVTGRIIMKKSKMHGLTSVQPQ